MDALSASAADNKPISPMDAALLRVAPLIAPLSLGDFYHLLIKNGFSEQGYLNANPDLIYLASERLALFLHFCEEGILGRRYFQPDLQGRDILPALQDLFNAPLHNRTLRMALVANFACSFLNKKIFHDDAVTGGTQREAADQFSDYDLATLLTCKLFGAIPYFVMGDSHSRLYQHAGLFNEESWLLPVSVTCRGGSARGLDNPNSRFKYGERLRHFFQRIQARITQGDKCFFKFGQVDLEYLFNFKWSQEGYAHFNEEKFIEYSNETIRRYTRYLASLVPPQLRCNTYVCSVSLPALADQACKETYIKGIFAFTPHSEHEIEKTRPMFDKMEIPDIITRTRLHLEYNQRLKVAVEAEGFPFANDTVLFLDENTKKVHTLFTMLSGGLDVHIDRAEPTLNLIGPWIHKLIKTL